MFVYRNEQRSAGAWALGQSAGAQGAPRGNRGHRKTAGPSTQQVSDALRRDPRSKIVSKQRWNLVIIQYSINRYKRK